jgi:predicted transcriptional regulator
MTTSGKKSLLRNGVMAVDEANIFTDELPTTGRVKLISDDDFFASTSQRVRQISDRHPLQALANVSFNSAQAFLNVMTPRRYELLKTVKEKGRFDSIELLAAALRRDRGAVSKDVKALGEAGLLLVRDVVLSGHGRRSEITPVARMLKVGFSL